MKKLLAVLFFYPTILFAQLDKLPMKDGKVFFEVVDSTNQTKDEIFTKAELAIAKIFNKSKSVLQIDDKESGKLVGKGNGMLPNSIYRLWFTFQIDCKDHKYRIQVYDLLGDNNYTKEPIESIKPKKTDSTENLINNFIASVQKQINESDDF